MTLHADVVRVLSGWTPPDTSQDLLRRDFLSHLQAYEDGVWRGCVPGHITGSAAVVDPAGARVLLTLHPKARLWLQMGGHLEPSDATLADAALREAIEESGIDGLRLRPGPVRLDRHRVWCHGGSYHLDVQYVAIAPPGARERISDESDDLRWFPMDDLPAQTDDALRRLVASSRTALA